MQNTDFFVCSFLIIYFYFYGIFILTFRKIYDIVKNAVDCDKDNLSVFMKA